MYLRDEIIEKLGYTYKQEECIFPIHTKEKAKDNGPNLFNKVERLLNNNKNKQLINCDKIKTKLSLDRQKSIDMQNSNKTKYTLFDK